MYRIETRLRNCRRPTSTGSGSANSPPTSCAPCQQTPAELTIRSHHSRRGADCATEEASRTRQRFRLLLSRQEIPNAWSADEAFKKENAERRTQKGRASLGILFSRPDTNHENPDQLFDFI